MAQHTNFSEHQYNEQWHDPIQGPVEMKNYGQTDVTG
jgi:hypothetical protein